MHASQKFPDSHHVYIRHHLTLSNYTRKHNTHTTMK